MRNWGIKNKAPQAPASPLEENRNEKTKAEGAVGWGGGWAKGLLPLPLSNGRNLEFSYRLEGKEQVKGGASGDTEERRLTME